MYCAMVAILKRIGDLAIRGLGGWKVRCTGVEILKRAELA